METASTTQPSETVQDPSPKSTEPVGVPVGPEDVKVTDEPMMDQDPPTFQHRMDGVRDSFRETYSAFTGSKTGASEAKVELDKAQAVYDGKMTEVSDARTENLVATRDYIRILQEHEATLVAEG